MERKNKSATFWEKRYFKKKIRDKSKIWLKNCLNTPVSQCVFKIEHPIPISFLVGMNQVTERLIIIPLIK